MSSKVFEKVKNMFSSKEDDSKKQSVSQHQDPFLNKVEEILDEQIRPFLQMHGGGVEIIEYKENKLFMKMFGGCQGCASSSATLKDGIEIVLKNEFEEIQEVVDLTDHSAGENPFL